MGDHTYAEGTVIPITATPASGWRFDNWTGDVANPNSASTTVTMDSDKTITAYFSDFELIVTFNFSIAVSGQGTTNPSPGIHTYDEGTPVTITALPAPTWEFDHWEGDASGSSLTTTITLNSDKSVTAYFKPVSDVQITYIFYDGLVPRVESDEYVEITNLGDKPQDLAGWVLKDISEGYPSFTFPSYILAPGASIRVYTNEIHPEWGGFSFDYGRAIWDNKDPDTAVLYYAPEQEASRKSY